MASGPFSKQAVYFSQPKLNVGTGDSIVGGALTTSPITGAGAPSQFQQTLPGDRIILSPSDALINSNNTVGNLYTGTFRYVGTRNNSSSAPTLGHAGFWDTNSATAVATSAVDALYQVTSDEGANIGVSLFAGVFISSPTKGNWWWIQEAGKVSVQFATVITGTPTRGAAVFLYAGGNNNNAIDVGSFDQLTGANSAAVFTANSTTGYTAVAQMLVRYAGVAEGLPSNNNVSVIDIPFSRSFRW